MLYYCFIQIINLNINSAIRSPSNIQHSNTIYFSNSSKKRNIETQNKNGKLIFYITVHMTIDIMVFISLFKIEKHFKIDEKMDPEFKD